MAMYYVTMTDSFLSGWGKAKNKTAKYVIPCSNKEEAEVVARNARARSEMKYVSIALEKPVYDPKRYQVTYGNKTKSKNWFIPGYFSR